MLKFNLIVLSLLISWVSFAQNTPREIAEKFFDDYVEDGASVALDNLYFTNKWINRSADAVANLKSKMEGLNLDFVGEYYGHELISEKKLGQSYVLLAYLAKFDRQPIRYIFQFYKPKDQWVVYSFKYDSSIDDEIEEAAKVFNLE
ncbi:MAG: hypothetical protein OER04_16710 [Cyclobacteriaceae bacterium]|nr:hypothetical protein [Cyclobacteriaceae bacterium]